MAPSISFVASEHPIKAVTLFSSRKAEVVRVFAVDLVEGQNELSITSLPSCIDVESARVTGLSDAVLFDVVCTISDDRDVHESYIQGSKLRELERRRGVLQGERTLLYHAGDILVKYGRTMSAENNPADVVEDFIDSLAHRGSRTLKKAEELDAQLAEVEEDIVQEKRRLEKERKRAPTHGRVTAVIMAKHAGKVDITLTYMVSNASWSPSYDLRATTENGRPTRTVSLHYRAAIQQSTGEDWRDTVISVSTATPGTTWASIPSLRTMRIFPGMTSVGANIWVVGSFGYGQQQQVPKPGLFGNAVSQGNAPAQSAFGHSSTPAGTMFGQSGQLTPAQPVPQASGAFGSQESRTSAHGVPRVPPPDVGQPVDVTDSWTSIENFDEKRATNAAPESTDAGDEKDGTWTETKAVVSESAVASSFRIEGNCTIPSEPMAHKVGIAILSFDATINYIAVPRSLPIAFLQCEVVNTSEYRLLPGPVSVYLDNSPVSKTSILDINPEEVLKCTLGPDPSLRIKCTRLPRTIAKSGSAFAAQTTSATYKLCATVQNTHSFPVRGLVVRDAAPVPSEAEQQNAPGIKVLIKKPTNLGEAAPNALVDVPRANSNTSSSVKVRWAQGGGDKNGKYEWLVDVGAGEEVKLEAEYEVRAPSDFVWHLREEFYRD
ncbi:hypothetical protein DFH11DRAFT_1571997 [Phellopilus nigrolimitatus]|nr:hypothetical protein DFH11DRAFT_1571997 [Phellopilus nigrolimitatus]